MKIQIKQLLALTLLSTLIFSNCAFAENNNETKKMIELSEKIKYDSKKVIALSWGTAENQVGKLYEEEAKLDFISPGSFFETKDKIYILDTPNDRISIFLKSGKLEKSIKLPAGTEKSPSLYTDIAVLNDGTILAANSREKVIYKITNSEKIEKISPKCRIQMITHISASDQSNILIEDPMSGNNFIMDFNGTILNQAPLELQPVLLSGGSVMKLSPDAISETAEISAIKEFRVTAEIFEQFGKKNSRKFQFKMPEPVQNLILLGEETTGVYLIYAVMGKNGDMPDKAQVISVEEKAGKILKSINIPISPEMSVMRYIRMSHDKKAVLFCSATESDYVINEYKL